MNKGFFKFLINLIIFIIIIWIIVAVIVKKFPMYIFDGEYATDCAKIKLATMQNKKNINNVLCNAFAFGGSNASVIIGR